MTELRVIKIMIHHFNMHKSTQAELLATILLEGKAIHKDVPNSYDIWWSDQGREVEVKSTRIKSSDIGKKYIHFDIRANWMKNFYYMLMIYIDDKFDHCYLNPSSDIHNRPSKSKSISLPKNWDNFEHKSRLYAYMTEKGIIRC